MAAEPTTQPAAASGTVPLGDLTVNRMGFGAMRLTGTGVWGDPPDREARRAAPNREVRVAHLRRHGAGGLSLLDQVLGEARRHPPQLVLQLVAVADVTLEGLLGADRDPFGARLERAWVNAARPVAKECSDLAGEELPQLGVGQVCKCADRLQPRRPQPLLGARADPG